MPAPTDTVLGHDQLFRADGYGLNYVTAIDVNKKQWKKIFGGKSDSLEDGKFTTAHGMGLHPLNQHIHNHRLYLVCQSWNPGHYFGLQHDIGLCLRACSTANGDIR